MYGFDTTNYNTFIKRLKCHLIKGEQYIGVLGVISKNYKFKAYVWNSFNYPFGVSGTVNLLKLITKTINSVGKTSEQVDIILYLKHVHSLRIGTLMFNEMSAISLTNKYKYSKFLSYNDIKGASYKKSYSTLINAS